MSWSVGSILHDTGGCKPCAFFHTKGCQSGSECLFCHKCMKDEGKHRKRAARRKLQSKHEEESTGSMEPEELEDWQAGWTSAARPEEQQQPPPKEAVKSQEAEFDPVKITIRAVPNMTLCEADFRSFFTTYGEIEEIHVDTERGTCLLKFASPDSVYRCLKRSEKRGLTMGRIAVEARRCRKVPLMAFSEDTEKPYASRCTWWNEDQAAQDDWTYDMKDQPPDGKLNSSSSGWWQKEDDYESDWLLEDRHCASGATRWKEERADTEWQEQQQDEQPKASSSKGDLPVLLQMGPPASCQTSGQTLSRRNYDKTTPGDDASTGWHEAAPEQGRDNAATRIAAAWRGLKARQCAASVRLLRLNAAITIVQKHARGYITRKKVQPRLKLRLAAAARIRGLLYMRRAQDLLLDMRRKEKAARCIQGSSYIRRVKQRVLRENQMATLTRTGAADAVGAGSDVDAAHAALLAAPTLAANLADLVGQLHQASAQLQEAAQREALAAEALKAALEAWEARSREPAHLMPRTSPAAVSTETIAEMTMGMTDEEAVAVGVAAIEEEVRSEVLEISSRI